MHSRLNVVSFCVHSLSMRLPIIENCGFFSQPEFFVGCFWSQRILELIIIQDLKKIGKNHNGIGKTAHQTFLFRPEIKPLLRMIALQQKFENHFWLVPRHERSSVRGQKLLDNFFDVTVDWKQKTSKFWIWQGSLPAALAKFWAGKLMKFLDQIIAR